jgi:cobalamin biosynthesis Mg chelatase CobN
MSSADIKCLLAKNTNEITSIVRALRGEYIKPGVGGDLLRDVSYVAYIHM